MVERKDKKIEIRTIKKIILLKVKKNRKHQLLKYVGVKLPKKEILRIYFVNANLVGVGVVRNIKIAIGKYISYELPAIPP